MFAVLFRYRDRRGWGVAVFKTPSPVATEIFAQAAGPDWSGFTMGEDGLAVHLVQRTLPRGRTYSPGPRPRTGWADLPDDIRHAIRHPRNLGRLANGHRLKGHPNVQTVDITELELPVVKSAYKQVTGSVLKTKDEDEAREALESALEQKNMGLFFDEDGDLAIQPLKKAAKAKAKTPEPEEDEEEVEETPAPKSKAKAKAAPEPEEDDEEEIEEEPAPKPKAKAKAKAPEPEEDEVDEEPAPKTKAKKAKAADGEDAPKKERKSKKGVKPDFTPRLKKDAVLEIGDTSKAPRAESILGRAFAVIEDGMTYGDALEAIEKTFKGLDSKPTPGGVFANLLNRGAVKVAEAE